MNIQETIDALIPKQVTMRQIVKEVSEKTGQSIHSMMGYSRRSPIIKARHIAIWHCCKAGYTTTQVGRFFNRDHTSVIYARDKIERLLEGQK